MEDQLEGLVFKFEDRHAIQNLFEVSEVKCLTSNFNQDSTVLKQPYCLPGFFHDSAHVQ